MAYTIEDSRLGFQPIAVTSTTQNHPEGMIVRAEDPILGGGEFIYLKGVVSTLLGSLVTYDPVNHTTTLSPNTGLLGQPVAVSMSANVASQWGWYQINGAAVIKKTAVKVSPAVPLFQSGTTGRVMSTIATGKRIMNTVSVNAATIASATSTITAFIQRPYTGTPVA